MPQIDTAAPNCRDVSSPALLNHFARLIDAGDMTSRRQPGQMIYRHSRSEAYFQYAVIRCDLKEFARPNAAFGIRACHDMSGPASRGRAPTVPWGFLVEWHLRGCKGSEKYLEALSNDRRAGSGRISLQDNQALLDEGAAVAATGQRIGGHCHFPSG
jgi:hypothetical protein